MVRSALPGYRGLRADVLIALKKAQPVTAQELAERFGVTANALRRHLDLLVEEEVVTWERQPARGGAGKPSHAYRLTESGEALFPHSYADALTDALEMVRRQAGTEGVVELFRARWRTIAAGMDTTVASLPLNERAQLAAELLTSHGYMAEVAATAATAGGAAGVALQVHNCPIRAVAERFPEVCLAEAEFLETMLGAPVRRGASILTGCNACAYVAAPAAPEHRLVHDRHQQHHQQQHASAAVSAA